MKLSLLYNPTDLHLPRRTLAKKLTIPQSSTGFMVIEFSTPTKGLATRAERVRHIQSFEPQNISIRESKGLEFGLRFYSDPNRPAGQYLFDTFPASRSSFAIKPEWSTMSGFKQFEIKPGTTIIEGRASAQGPHLSGGQIQKIILDWRSSLITP